MIYPAADLSAEIIYLRYSNKTQKWKEYGSIIQQPTFCRAGHSISGYSPLCGEHTADSSSSMKTYRLVIESAKEEDFTLWICSIRHNKVNGQAVYLYKKKIELHLEADHKPALRLKQKLTLICRVTGDAKQISEVVFIRNGTNGTVIIGRVKTGCKNESVDHGYKLHCEKSDEDNNTINYMLSILSMQTEDYVQWWCETQPSGTKSNAVSFTQVMLYLHISANATSVPMNEAVKLSCVVSPADFLDDEICFLMADGTGNNVSSFSQGGNHCKVNFQKPGYLSACGNNTNVNNSVEKLYELIIERMGEHDFTKWRCKSKTLVSEQNAVILKQSSKYFCR